MPDRWGRCYRHPRRRWILGGGEPRERRSLAICSSKQASLSAHHHSSGRIRHRDRYDRPTIDSRVRSGRAARVDTRLAGGGSSRDLASMERRIGVGRAGRQCLTSNSLRRQRLPRLARAMIRAVAVRFCFRSTRLMVACSRRGLVTRRQVARHSWIRGPPSLLHPGWTCTPARPWSDGFSHDPGPAVARALGGRCGRLTGQGTHEPLGGWRACLPQSDGRADDHRHLRATSSLSDRTCWTVGAAGWRRSDVERFAAERGLV